MTNTTTAKYETTIGLEIHVQLATKTKMFCRCDNDSETAEPNTNVCPVCMGYPGTLPVTNRQAIDFGMRLARALGCELNRFQRFDRKNYFYPDLPKGYQISQFFYPVGEHGKVTIDRLATDRKTKLTFDVGITRLHLEEDAGKLSHAEAGSLVDLNRCGTPLAEIVTGPDIHSPEEARAFMQELQRIVRSLGVSAADMEKGHLRVDGNISIRPMGAKELGAKVEIKNMNSFKFLEQALKYEIERQAGVLDAGEVVVQETRGWDEKTGTTISQRIKEGSVDYRYFPDPDLPPLNITDEWLAAISVEEDKLPVALRTSGEKFISYGRVWELQDHDQLKVFVSLAETMANQGDLDWLAKALLAGNSFATATEALEYQKSLAEEAAAKSAAWGDADKLSEVVAGVLADNPEVVERLQAGEEKLHGVLMGQVMSKTGGQADAALVKEILNKLLTK